MIDIAKVVTWLGAPALMWTIVALSTLALALRRRTTEAIVLGGGMLLTIGFVRLAKDSLQRPRPSNELVEAAGYSYPSAHAAYAVAWIVLAIIAVRVVPWLRGRWWLVFAAFLIAVVVGLTRAYLRVHWWSDVLGGAGAASMSFALVAVVTLVVTELRKNETG